MKVVAKEKQRDWDGELKATDRELELEDERVYEEELLGDDRYIWREIDEREGGGVERV